MPRREKLRTIPITDALAVAKITAVSREHSRASMVLEDHRIGEKQDTFDTVTRRAGAMQSANKETTHYEIRPVL